MDVQLLAVAVGDLELTVCAVPEVRARIVTTPDGRLLRRVGGDSQPLRGDAMGRFVREGCTWPVDQVGFESPAGSVVREPHGALPLHDIERSRIDAVLTPGATPVRLVHLSEARAAVEAAYAALGRPAPAWTDAAPAAGTTSIRAAHLLELQAAAAAVE